MAQGLETLRTGRLPERYGLGGADPFFEAFYRPFLRPDICILDVGGGRAPVLPPESRPPRSRYVGFDVSETELRNAPPGSYDALVIADATEYQRDLESSIDLVLSYQVLEHVRPIDRALNNFCAYLRPHGRLVAQLSGGNSVFAIASRILPRRLVGPLLRRVAHRAPETIFPTQYDRCSSKALHNLLKGWSVVEIVPRYDGAGYFRFSRVLQAAYIGYEEWTVEHPDLATHYVISATPGA